MKFKVGLWQFWELMVWESVLSAGNKRGSHVASSTTGTPRGTSLGESIASSVHPSHLWVSSIVSKKLDNKRQLLTKKAFSSLFHTERSLFLHTEMWGLPLQWWANPQLEQWIWTSYSNLHVINRHSLQDGWLSPGEAPVARRTQWYILSKVSPGLGAWPPALTHWLWA